MQLLFFKLMETKYNCPIYLFIHSFVHCGMYQMFHIDSFKMQIKYII